MLKTKETKSPRSSCPLVAALDRVGDKWSLVVLRDVMTGNYKYGGILA